MKKNKKTNLSNEELVEAIKTSDQKPKIILPNPVHRWAATILKNMPKVIRNNSKQRSHTHLLKTQKVLHKKI